MGWIPAHFGIPTTYMDCQTLQRATNKKLTLVTAYCSSPCGCCVFAKNTRSITLSKTLCLVLPGACRKCNVFADTINQWWHICTKVILVASEARLVASEVSELRYQCSFNTQLPVRWPLKFTVSAPQVAHKMANEICIGLDAS